MAFSLLKRLPQGPIGHLPDRLRGTPTPEPQWESDDYQMGETTPPPVDPWAETPIDSSVATQPPFLTAPSSPESDASPGVIVIQTAPDDTIADTRSPLTTDVAITAANEIIASQDLGDDGVTTWDWDDPSPPQVVQVAPTSPESVPDGIELPDYDSGAHQQIWTILPDDADPKRRQARAKAALVASVLEVDSRTAQDEAVSWLTELFLDQPYATTFSAVLGIAGMGTDLALLRNMAVLREIWADRLDWWVGRNHRGHAYQLRNGRHAMTWKLARRICHVRQDLPPEAMIDEHWLKEWLRLSDTGDQVFSLFPVFIAQKINQIDSDILYRGLVHESDRAENDDPADLIDWRKLLAHFGTRGMVFSTIEPVPQVAPDLRYGTFMETV